MREIVAEITQHLEIMMTNHKLGSNGGYAAVPANAEVNPYKTDNFLTYKVNEFFTMNEHTA